MNVLVAYDGSAPAQQALAHAARVYADDEIVLLRVAEASDGSIEAGVDLVQETIKELRRETAAEIDPDIDALLDEADIDLRMEMVSGEPSREIVEYAEEHDVDVIVIGNHGRRGVSRILLGSVAEKVVRRAPMTVVVVR